MGFGDAIMATNLARGLHAQGKFAAFGNGQTIKWTGYCEDIFKHNPNIARPGMEGQDNLVWFPHYKKNLTYCTYDGYKCKYIWNYEFKAQPGEMFFPVCERRFALPESFIVIEPNVVWDRAVHVNKDWGEGKYEKLAKALMKRGHVVVQCIHNGSRRKIPGAQYILTGKCRDAIEIMAHASLFIGPEGANHHAAAAVGIPAIIIWGGWSPVQTMGYESHINLTGGSTEACGNTSRCGHCRDAFNRITVDEVYEHGTSIAGS